MGTTISLRMPHGETEAYVAGDAAHPPVIFFMDGIGLRPTLFAMADRLASHGYRVLLPNMFWRSGPFEPFDPARIFGGDTAERERLRPIFLATTDDDAMRDTAAFLDHLGADKVACIGYCMGGGLSVYAACTYPDRVIAAASFHGGRFLVTPQAPDLIAKQLRARVYIAVSEIDQSHNAEVTQRLEAALTTAGVPHTIELYPGVAHGFCVPDLPPYNRDAAERHWDRLLALLRDGFA